MSISVSNNKWSKIEEEAVKIITDLFGNLEPEVRSLFTMCLSEWSMFYLHKEFSKIHRCESVIEKLLYIALIHRWFLTLTFVHRPKYYRLIVLPQRKLKLGEQTIRVDFLVVLFEFAYIKNTTKRKITNKAQVVVECDGHDYHERTKEQARRDRMRDRLLQTHGYPIFRFTGSEIYNDPEDCAMQIIQFLLKEI